jgi:hypothetical protein
MTPANPALTMSSQESKDHRLGLKLAETLGVKKSGNLYRTGWGLITPVRLVRSLRLMIDNNMKGSHEIQDTNSGPLRVG